MIRDTRYLTEADRLSGFQSQATALAMIIAGDLVSEPDPHIVEAIQQSLVEAYKTGKADGQMGL